MEITKSQSNNLKGVAIGLVIVSHLFPWYTGVSGLNPLGPIGVNIFLILSAYGLKNSLINPTSINVFLRKRFARILPAYWMICGLLFFFGLITDNLNALPSVAGLFVLFDLNWYVQFILIFYIAVLCSMVFRTNLPWVLFCVSVWIFGENKLWVEASLAPLMGLFLARIPSYSFHWAISSLAIISLITLVAVSKKFFGVDYFMLNAMVWSALSVFLIIHFDKVTLKRVTLLGLLAWLGNRSYHIYLCHVSALYFLSSWENPTLMLFVQILSTIFLGHLLWVCDQKFQARVAKF